MNKKVASGLFWKLLENGGSQAVQFVVSVILARLLSPREYTVIAIIMIFTTIANVLVQNGFATALIQRKDADGVDFSSVFFLNLFSSLVVYIFMFLLSPVIARFYHQPQMVKIFRVMSVIVFPGAIISVQNAYVAKKMEFRSLFISTLFAAIFSGGVSIFMAMKGMGVWALVWQQIVYYVVLMMVLFVTIDWLPSFVCDFERLGEMFQFGWKLLCASLIDTIFNNLQGLVMGRVYSDDVLGNYNRGEQFPKLIVTNLGAAMQSVLLPVMAEKQDERLWVKSMLRKSITLSSYIVLPMMAGMAAVADTLIAVLLGPKWSGSVIFLQLMCASYAFWPIHIANLQALNAVGKSDMFLKLEIIKKALSLVVLVIGISYGAVALIALKAVADFLCTFINAWPNKKILHYSIWEQWRDIMSSVVISLLMGMAVYASGRIFSFGVIRLGIQIFVGIVVYILLSMWTKNESFLLLVETMRKGKGSSE